MSIHHMTLKEQFKPLIAQMEKEIRDTGYALVDANFDDIAHYKFVVGQASGMRIALTMLEDYIDRRLVLEDEDID